MRLWHIAVLLIAGIVVGVLFPGRLTDVFGTATLYVFLPALIFEGAWHLDLHVMRRMWRPIAMLAIPGVAVTAAIIAACAHYFGALTWPASLLLGAVLSATDPVAVIAIFRRLDVPKRLTTIVESESLLNDAIAVVLYRTVIAAIIATTSVMSVSSAAALAIVGVAIGVSIGVGLAFVASLALREQVGAPIQIAATFLGAYGGYALADHFGWSGIFAVLAFGIALRELERHRISVSSAQDVEHFWHGTATFANVFLFFLIGAALDFTRMRQYLPLAGAAIAGVFFARTILAYGMLQLVHPVHPAWRTVVRMAGIRGALSLALALATPRTIPDRTGIVHAAFAVVVVTLLIGSLTLHRRVSRLPLHQES
jgi:CPA1 family monovalent cation:H+ antiporter